MKSSLRVLGTIASVGIGFSVLQATSADAASFTWDMTFFDATGAQVGIGSFSYDPDTSTIVDVNGGLYAPNPMVALPIPPGTQDFQVQTALDMFSAVLFDQVWSLSQSYNSVNWFNPIPDVSLPVVAQGTGAWSQSYIRGSTATIISHSWMFATGGRPIYTDALSIYGGQSDPQNPTTIQGTWLLLDGRIPPNSTGNIYHRGGWTAQAVPEPTTILGSAIVGLGLALRKKLAGKSKDQLR